MQCSAGEQQCTICTHSPSPGWAVLAHHPVTFPLFSPWYEKRMLTNSGESWGGFSGTFLSIPSECFTDFPKQIFVPHMLGMMACFCWTTSLGMKTQPLVLSSTQGTDRPVCGINFPPFNNLPGICRAIVTDHTNSPSPLWTKLVYFALIWFIWKSEGLKHNTDSFHSSTEKE